MRRMTLRFILMFSLVTIYSPVLAVYDTTVLWLDPTQITFGPNYCVGETFTLACKIRHYGLASFELQITWNTTYLEYMNHTLLVPVEDHPDGILHKPVMIIADIVNEVQGTYDCAASTVGGGLFNGTGTTFEITFRVKNQPISPEEDVGFWTIFTYGDIYPDIGLMGVWPELTEENHITIHAYEEPPPSPPVGGTSVSIDSSEFSTWATSTLLIVVVVIALNFKLNWRRRKH